MRYETQAELLRLLARIARHYAAAALSLPATPSLDGARLVTFGCLACLADAVLLAEVSDVPSIFGTHYAGRAGGPTSPFGFGLGGLDGELEAAPLLCPYLVAARTRILDYSSARVGSLQPDHLILQVCRLPLTPSPPPPPPLPPPPHLLHLRPQFEKSMRLSPSDVNFISQLSFAGGVAVDARAPPSYYLAGVNPELHILCPELAALRDIVFLLKAMMAPTADLLPEPKKWRPVHAVLEWTVLEDETLQVSGFGGVLRCAAYAAEDAKVKRGGAQGVAAALGALVGGGPKSEERRVPPSAALAGSHINGSDVKTEDDVLHVPTKALPDFNGKIKPHDSELLLQYLTVPYLRIPLIARFLADRTRVKALVSPQLQALVDGVFFEAGPWRQAGPLALPDTIPVTERAVLATPAGLLLHELRCSPEPLIEALTELLELALEIDTGRHVRASSPIVLYVIRLLARVDGYVRLLLEPPADVRGISNDSDRRSLTGAPPLAGGLGAMWAKIQTALRTRAAPMLLAWCGRAVAERQLLVACGLHAHVALIHAHLKEDELDEEAVGALLNAQVFINTNCQRADAHGLVSRRRPPAPCPPHVVPRSPPPFSLITRMSEPPTAKWYGQRPAAASPAPRRSDPLACPRRSRSPNPSLAAPTLGCSACCPRNSLTRSSSCGGRCCGGSKAIPPSATR